MRTVLLEAVSFVVAVVRDVFQLFLYIVVVAGASLGLIWLLYR